MSLRISPVSWSRVRRVDVGPVDNLAAAVRRERDKPRRSGLVLAGRGVGGETDRDVLPVALVFLREKADWGRGLPAVVAVENPVLNQRVE